MSLSSGVKITADVDDLTRKLDYAMGRIVNVVATLSYGEPDWAPCRARARPYATKRPSSTRFIARGRGARHCITQAKRKAAALFGVNERGAVFCSQFKAMCKRRSAAKLR